MASVKITGTLKGAEGLELIGEWLDWTFDNMVQELPDVLTTSLSVAGHILKESVKQEFGSKMPAAARPFKVPATSKGGYVINKPDMLIEAAKQSKKDPQHVTVFMGGREPHSPLFIARMYDKDSNPRYVKTKKGMKLNPRRYVGKLTGVHYWDAGIQAGEQEAYDAIERIISNKLDNIL